MSTYSCLRHDDKRAALVISSGDRSALIYANAERNLEGITTRPKFSVRGFHINGEASPGDTEERDTEDPYVNAALDLIQAAEWSR